MKSHEATIKHLEAYAKREDEALRGLAATRDSAATKLKAAQKNLAAYCTKAAYASDNPGYNADASRAAPLKKVQLAVGPAC
ncbi:hypothetical protein ACFY13_10095 [Streptomyces mirabilis]|uniref:hypothetical protein n=1 Tax=Streptomyces mirabilis TaxID=68239 RepID=UPI0022523926|nr:hypothetical protein [Streptomyces mirabilis]MCX5353769.1 hypothetical protein [Streptomyces mirabilis]